MTESLVFDTIVPFAFFVLTYRVRDTNVYWFGVLFTVLSAINVILDMINL